jgi:pimeloyl-ACP methyl ester carboxylesterase
LILPNGGRVICRLCRFARVILLSNKNQLQICIRLVKTDHEFAQWAWGGKRGDTMMQTIPIARTRTLVRADGIELATEAFGNPVDLPVILIMGAMASMLWWPEEFCRQLAGRGLYALRYDNRDTGLSTTCEPGAPDYTFDDMVDDVLRVLDEHGLAAAHLVGMSMGGAIAQLAALERPARVLSLTAISTSPVGADRSKLPQSAAAFAEHSQNTAPPDWSDRDAAIRYMVEEMRWVAGTLPFDEVSATELAGRDYDRAKNPASAANHYALKEGKPRQYSIAELQVPLLVIHGTADPLFPIAHGEEFLHLVPGAGMVRLEGGGHELHPVHWPEIVAAIAATQNAEVVT